jgi:hypothetical protein
MATIQKTFMTSLENVVVLADGARAVVAVRDTADPENVTARMIIAVKAGKLIQPPTDENVDPEIIKACATLMKCFTALSDKIVTDKPIFIRGSVPPASPQSPRPR